MAAMLLFLTSMFFILIIETLDFYENLENSSNFQNIWTFDFDWSITERYHELYPPKSERNIDSSSETSSVNVMWAGVPFAALVFLVLALVAAFYFRAKAKKLKPRRPLPGYFDRNGFINPAFSRSHENFTNQDDMVFIASVSQVKS